MPTFRAEIQLSGKTASGIPVPDDVVESLGAGKRVAIVAGINGYSYRTSVSPYNGRYMIPISGEHRDAAGVAAGEVHDVTIEVDTAPRTVDVPDDLASAIAGPARENFDALSYSKQRAHVLAVEGAKTPETRQRRIDAVVDALSK